MDLRRIRLTGLEHSSAGDEEEGVSVSEAAQKTQ